MQIQYYSVRRNPTPFGDALTAPDYVLDTFQSHHVVHYSTQTGYNRHVLATMRDLAERGHKILTRKTFKNGNSLHVWRDDYGLLGVIIPLIDPTLIDTEVSK
jgi:hypothetical protein